MSFKRNDRVVFNGPAPTKFNPGVSVMYARILDYQTPFWRILLEPNDQIWAAYESELVTALDPNELLKEIL